MDKSNKQKLLELSEFLQNKGFIWGPSPELYGGVSGFYSYGPLGKLLKNNVENFIRKHFEAEDFWEVEVPIIQPKIVWSASGHLSGFTDPLVKCSKCGAVFRADKLIEELFPDKEFSNNNLLKTIKELKIRCPSCKSEFEDKIYAHDLMMKTNIGVDSVSYLRPETATTTYLPVKRYYDFFRNKTPFGVFQIGKAFRNEISPRQLTLRMREFTQAEAQLFIFEEDKNNFLKFDSVKDIVVNAVTKDLEELRVSIGELYSAKHIKNKAYAYAIAITYKLFLELGFDPDKIRLRQHRDDEKAFYADDAWDIEFKLNTFGWYEIAGVHDRRSYDLEQHQKFSKKSLELFDEASKTKKLPNVIEIAFGVDRPVFSILDMFYEKKEKTQGKNIFALPKKIAPITLAVLPLMKKDQLKSKARAIFDDLKTCFRSVYDESGSIGKRYLRQSESGTPFCVTIDYQTLEDDTVTIRLRDTEEQIRVKVSELKNKIYSLLYE